MANNSIDEKRKCDTCQAEIKSASLDGLHTNGYWRIFYTYKCGCREEFSPNFMKHRVLDPCPKDPMIQEERENFKNEMDKLILYMNDLNLSEKDLKNLGNKLDSFKRYRY